MAFFDLDTEAGVHADRRMREELTGWLTTVARDGTPQSSPVAFLWNGERIKVFSEPDAPKVKNLIENHRCSFHLNSDDHGCDIVIIEGTVAVEPDGAPWSEAPGFREKYNAAFQTWGLDLEASAGRFSQVLTITPVRVRTW